MRVIGLCGKTGSGKGAAAAWLAERHGAVRLKHSDVLRELLARNGKRVVPANMSALFEAIAGQLGYQWIAAEMVRRMFDHPRPASIHEGTTFVVDGIRNPQEVAFYHERVRRPGNGFTLLALDAPQQTRFGRVRNRGERENERDMTWEAFVAIESLESHTGEAAVMAMADVRIDNNGTLDAFHAELDRLLRP